MQLSSSMTQSSSRSSEIRILFCLQERMLGYQCFFDIFLSCELHSFYAVMSGRKNESHFGIGIHKAAAFTALPLIMG